MLIGNVGRDPEVRYLDGQAGSSKVAQFTLATTERYRDRNNELRENTEWHNIVAWRGNADVCEKYVRKGSQLYIEGRIRTRSWDDQTGNKRYTTEIIADNLQLLGKRSDNPGAQQGAYQAQGAQTGGYQSNAGQQGGYQTPGVQHGYQQPGHQSQNQGYAAPAQPVKPAVEDMPDDDLPF